MTRLVTSFGFAGRGLMWTVRTERNFRIQLLCGVAALVLGFAIRISPAEFANIVLASALVLSLEAINTAAETYLDRFHAERDETVGLVKDIMAAAVALASMGAVLIGAAIFLGRLPDWV